MQSWTVPALKRASGQNGQSRQGGQNRISALKGIALGAGLIIALAAGLHSPPAAAHAMLTKAEPARRAQLTRPPAQVRLWFNEEVEKDYAALTVIQGDKPVTEAKPRVAEDDPKAIILPLPELSPGKYTVKFRVLSVDGHVVDSSYDFTVKSKVSGK
jgi:methionine-rich copper-binding protein CopC